MTNNLISIVRSRWDKYNFLFEELVKRDFKKKYKRTYLGIIWSMLGPLMQLGVMVLVFTHFFGRDIPHFPLFVFSGITMFNFFRESTEQGMMSLTANSGVLTKVKVPKWLFLLSRNTSALLNFTLILVVFFVYAFFDGVPFHPRFLLLIYPVITLTLFNIGAGLVLSALFIFFKDVQYLYNIGMMLVMWLSAIFFDISTFSENTQRLFLLNPVFTHIQYFRLVVLQGVVPSWHIQLLCSLYAVAALGVGAFFYKRYNYKFIYYM
ncbi:MAG: ABC transporter permease [Defluviitaleaceae bacterium]|nr:ABC transporter permease [Defluviitaleaceae bacterium]MCL2275251.1 ABC transporter permease [Defluviitaleaceae bacterium]